MLNDTWSALVGESICGMTSSIKEEVKITLGELSKPSVIYKPKIFKDGNAWCCFLGEDIQEGICGFGESPYKATEAFNTAFYAKEKIS